LLSPTILLFTVFIVLPGFYMLYLSLQNLNYAKPYRNGFVGLQNYVEMLHDAAFWNGLNVSAKWVVAEILLQLVCGMALALLLNQKIKGRGFFRAISFAPWAVSGTLTTMLWTLIYSQHIGVLNMILKALGLIGSEGIAWLGNEKTVFGAVVIAELWRGIPFFAINFLAGLQSIPQNIYEAGAMDGCGRFQSFWKLTLPFLKETIVMTILLRTIWTFNSFDMLYTMTGGGPFRLTTTLPIYTYQVTFASGEFGYGSALAVTSTLILLVFAAVFMKAMRYGGNVDE